MTTEEQMTIDEVYKYPRLIKPRYARVNRQQKNTLPDEMEQVTGRHRRSLPRLLRGNLE